MEYGGKLNGLKLATNSIPYIEREASEKLLFS